jgi:hypothetical protein
LYLNYFILINASAFLFQEFSSMKNEFFIEKIEFWFCISILFYAVVSSFFFTFVQYTIGYGTAEYELLTHMYGICQSTPLLISGLIFSIAIFKNKNSIRW